MKKCIFALAILTILIACSGETSRSISSNLGGEKVWIWAQFNVPEEGENGDKIDSYYYYGRVSKQLYRDILENRLSEGFVYLLDVHYWTENDGIKQYKDELDNGNMVFKIEHIARIAEQKGAPRTGSSELPVVEPEQTSPEIISE